MGLVSTNARTLTVKQVVCPLHKASGMAGVDVR